MSQTRCICDGTGCKDNCPNVFYQGGQPLHLIEQEEKDRPRIFKRIEPSSDPKISDNIPKPLFDQYVNERRAVLDGDWQDKGDDESEGMLEEVWKYTKPQNRGLDTHDPDGPHSTINSSAMKLKSRMQSGEAMMQTNRASLQKFESLRINGQSIVSTTIGGFTMDLTKVAQKAREILPLPPVKLPIIFQDETLNFYHHFFQGIELLLGRDVVETIISTDKYFEHDEVTLFPLLDALVGSGYESDDTEITVFTKRVISSTFEKHDNGLKGDNTMVLVVIADFWGFEYIEPGMQMRESDLKMWLSRCHDRYRIAWFNAFKSAGVPSFALSGVQDRYKSGSRFDKMKEIMPRASKPVPMGTNIFEDDPPHRPRRSRREKKSTPNSLAVSLFGRY